MAFRSSLHDFRSSRFVVNAYFGYEARRRFVWLGLGGRASGLWRRAARRAAALRPVPSAAAALLGCFSCCRLRLGVTFRDAAGIESGPLFRPRLAPHSEALSDRGMTERTMNRLLMGYLDRAASRRHA